MLLYEVQNLFSVADSWADLKIQSKVFKVIFFSSKKFLPALNVSYFSSKVMFLLNSSDYKCQNS